ncbi:MAG: hypothetical protein IKW46_08085 [Bacteroidaceae bacterium]|nr:hypothetical protein [Bacteroidaceae bacterium]
MTILEAISRVDAVKPNSYSQTEKIAWLSRIDATIKNEIIDTHEGAENITFNGYDLDTDTNTELLVPAPYDEVYIRYLEMHIDYANNEYGKYNNSMVMYNAAYAAYEKYYNRTHMPLSKGNRFIF